MHPQLGLGMRGCASPTVPSRCSLRRPQLRTKAGVKTKVIAIAKEEKNCAVYNRRNFKKELLDYVIGLEAEFLVE